MNSIDEEIESIEEEIRETPYNKSTEEHIGRLKAKLAKLKEEKAKKVKKQGGGRGYAVEKSGDATVVLTGYPSVGKSTLLNSLTGTESKVADYEFTTLDVVPGALKYKGANIQMLDIPGLISGASEGRGRGRKVLSIVRNADLLLLLLDPFELDQYGKLKEEIYNSGIRLNEKPPNVKIRRKESGGIDILAAKRPKISENEIRSILREYGVINAEVQIHENIGTDRLIDAVTGNREYLPGLVVITKMDLLGEEDMGHVKGYVEEKIEEDVYYTSVESGGLDSLKEGIYESLNFIRVYLKPRGRVADMEEPMIMKRGATVDDLCRRIHRNLREDFKYARIFGESAKHPNQKVGIDHKLADGDIVRIIS